jgi:hypothetical protein
LTGWPSIFSEVATAAMTPYWLWAAISNAAKKD